ncbi:MAG: site-2 protease family protein [Planctomycetales bacterium]|nr:site-2 protease family protein [Planctomycetales bacterium]MBN8623957.1 site-2 protease family protein [Planctomycetota bacterium]
MILQEPDRTPYDLRFQLFGVDVRVHPLFWLFGIFISGAKEPKVALIAVAAMFLSILIHEFGHVWAFKRYGISSHIVLHAFGGLAIPDGMRGIYGTGRRLSPAGSAFVAFAGPALEIAAALLIVVAVKLSGGLGNVGFGGILGLHARIELWEFPFLHLFLNIFIYLSIYWGLLNLLPIIPLDGGRMSQYFFNRYSKRDGEKQAIMLSLITAIVVGLYLFRASGDFLIVFLFGYLAYMNFQALQAYSGGRRW